MVRNALVSWSLAALSLLLAVGATLDHLETRSERRTELDRLGADNLRWLPEELIEDLRRERDPSRQRLRLARGLVAAEMDPVFLTEVQAAEGTGGSLERLALARALSAAALAERPTAWEAPMLLGAATYLARSRVRDPELFTAYRDWEAPLELAVSLSPGRTEAGRFLAIAYLELWPAVSEEKRKRARELIGEAFRDPGIFRRLAGIWLSVVTPRTEAFAPIPPDPESWQHVQNLMARAMDWDGYRVARERYREALEMRRERNLAEAERMLAGGETFAARDLLLRNVALGDPEAAAVPALVATLARLPPGPAGRHEGALRDWLDWALDLCLLDRCPLPAASLDRIAGLAGVLEPEEAAMAYLFAGRLPDAERLERRSDRLWHARWGPYLLAKARLLARRGQPAEAATALATVHSSWRDGPVYREVRREVSQAGGEVGELQPVPRPGDEAETWPRGAWRPAATGSGRAGGGAASGIGATDRLDLGLSREADGLQIEIAAAGAQGAVLEVRLDGQVVATPVVGRGRGAVVRPGEMWTLDTPLTPGLHRLEVETLAGERVFPGRIRLEKIETGGAERSPQRPGSSRR